MKRFDAALEVSKQLIAISVAFCPVVIAFYEKVFAKTDVTLVWYIYGSIGLSLMSIILGIFAIGAIVNGIEVTERNDHRVQNARRRGRRRRPGFISLNDTLAVQFALWQQLFFFASLVLFVVAAYVDQRLH